LIFFSSQFIFSRSFIMSTKSIFASAALAFAVSSFAQTATPQLTNLSPVGEPEASKVISVVSSIPLAVDLAAYDMAEKAFAPKVVIDYTSLWGGTPNTMTPSELMTAWRGIVPGFDATWHELSKVTAQVNGSKATAGAFVDGRHWIGDKLWRPVGNYEWDLEKQGGQWKVTRMAFKMTQEIGDRAVAGLAMEKAKQKAGK
jgi:SnoaL-like domain